LLETRNKPYTTTLYNIKNENKIRHNIRIFSLNKGSCIFANF
jgi:hypothetical protein